MKRARLPNYDQGDETTVGYFCQLMVNPQEVAKIFIDYNYALYRVLGEDAPDAMWKDLSRKLG